MPRTPEVPHQEWITAPVSREDKDRIQAFARERRVPVAHLIRAGIALIMKEPGRLPPRPPLPPRPRRPLTLDFDAPRRNGARGGR